MTHDAARKALADYLEGRQPDHEGDILVCMVSAQRDLIVAALRAHPGTVSREAVSDERAFQLAVDISSGAISAPQGAVEIMQYATDGVEQRSLTPPASGIEKALAELPEYLECLESDLIHLDVDFKLKDIIPPGVWADRVRAAFSTPPASGNAMREALEPFAKLAPLFDNYEIDRRTPEKDSVLVNVKLDALRNARAVLALTAEEHSKLAAGTGPASRGGPSPGSAAPAVFTAALPPEGREAVETVTIPKAALAWLHGEGPDESGKWFGESVPEIKPGKPIAHYWWRSKFRKLCALPIQTVEGGK